MKTILYFVMQFSVTAMIVDSSNPSYDKLYCVVSGTFPYIKNEAQHFEILMSYLVDRLFHLDYWSQQKRKASPLKMQLVMIKRPGKISFFVVSLLSMKVGIFEKILNGTIFVVH